MGRLDQNETDWSERNEADQLRIRCATIISTEEAAAPNLNAYRVSKLRTLTTSGIIALEDLDIPTFLRQKLKALLAKTPSDEDIVQFFDDWNHPSNPLVILLEATQRQSDSGEINTSNGLQKIRQQVGTVLDPRKVN